MEKKETNNRYREEEKAELEAKKDQAAEAKNAEEKNSDTIIKEEKDKIKKDAEKQRKAEIDLNAKIVDQEIQISRLENEVLLARANEINYKKRLDIDKAQAISYANQILLEKIVDQVDLFDSVVNMETKDPLLEKFLAGFKMISANFRRILDDEGVKKIAVKVGEEFDPKYQHSFDTEWNAQYKENAVLQELKAGYTYKDRVLRPALVKVNKRKEVKENE